MSVAKFKVTGLFDGARRATVEIDRDSLLFTVRPHRRHKVTDPIPLATVAQLVLHRMAKLALSEARAKRKKGVI